MSAETLRKAAELMRERAKAATPGPWECFGDHLVWPSEGGVVRRGTRFLARVGEANNDSARHIASWHPAVALAVADWLDEAADHLEDHSEFPRDAVCPTALGGLECSVLGQALTVAHAYLGDTP